MNSFSQSESHLLRRHDVRKSCSQVDVRMVRFGHVGVLLVSYGHGGSLRDRYGRSQCTRIDGHGDCDGDQTTEQHEAGSCACVEVTLSRALAMWGAHLSRIVVLCNLPSASKYQLRRLGSNRVFMQRCLKPLWLWKARMRRQEHQGIKVSVDVILPCKCVCTLECAHSSSGSHIGGGVEQYPARFLALRSLNSQGVHPTTGNIPPAWAKEPCAGRIALFAMSTPLRNCSSDGVVGNCGGGLRALLGSVAGKLMYAVDVGVTLKDHNGNGNNAAKASMHHRLVQVDSISMLVKQMIVSAGSTASPPKPLALLNQPVLETRRCELLSKLRTNEWFLCATQCAYYVHYVAEHLQQLSRGNVDDKSPTSTTSPLGTELLASVPIDTGVVLSSATTTTVSMSRNDRKGSRTSRSGASDATSLTTLAQMESLFTVMQQDKTAALLNASHRMQHVLDNLWLDEGKLKDFESTRKRQVHQVRTIENNTQVLWARGGRLQKDAQNKIMELRRERLKRIKQRQVDIGDEASLEQNLSEVAQLAHRAAEGLAT
jgi:hypothetical protein